MKSLYRIIPLIVVAIMAMCTVSYGAWVWTPESGSWFNPKNAAKDTAEEQFKWAMELYGKKEYKEAVAEFNKVVSIFPNSKYAPDAQYYIGRAYQDIEEYYRAYLAYQKVIEAYPYAKNRNEIIKRQYDIGVIFFNGQRSKILGMALLPAADKAIEIFQQIVKNSPYGEYAAKSQFKIGQAYKSSGRFAEATLAFQQLVEEYPDSDLAREADYQIAQCGYLASLDASYDQDSTDAAIEKFEDLVLEAGGDREFFEKTKRSLGELKEKRAASIYETALFYEKIGQVHSAAIYYKDLVDNYPQSKLAKESLARIMEIEKDVAQAER